MFLIVDDDEDLSETIVRIFNEKKIECRLASNVDAAMHTLSTEKWTPHDIILIDYEMPGKNGEDLVLWIRSTYPAGAVPTLVLMSAHPDIDERAKNLGISYFLKKPLDLNALLEL